MTNILVQVIVGVDKQFDSSQATLVFDGSKKLVSSDLRRSQLQMAISQQYLLILAYHLLQEMLASSECGDSA